MLTLILADSELELVPEEVKSHPSIQSASQRRGTRAARTILDSSAHHAAMKGLHDGDRRGRPDIVHLFLLTTLDSVLNLEGGLRVLVHTRHDDLITIDPETRIMRSFDRFCGLMEQLFRQGQAGPPGRAPLLTLQTGAPLAEVIKRTAADHVVALETGGPVVDLAAALPPIAQSQAHVAVIVGGFPKGGYRSPVQSLAHATWTLHPEMLSVWVAASEVLVNWENATRGMAQHRGAAPQRRTEGQPTDPAGS
ncbi:MAG TPA: 16S rRNA methyltransferase [Candidatus Thermoplasmatota archaeon]|nr:16S rRNA methyltransferase [Candidatus Thermoplasmatota archaeon]